MKVFLSSTCYDLKDLRAEVEEFLIKKGHEVLLSDRADFPHPTGTHRHDVCVKNVNECDLFILVLDRRFGAPYYKNEDISITWAEFREAIRSEKNVLAFVRQEIFSERQTCRLNQKKGNVFNPFFVDNIKTFDIIDEVQKHESGVWMQPFDNSVQIKAKLENMYETKHSPLTPSVSRLELSSNEKIPIGSLSGSTATFIENNYKLSGKDLLDIDTLKSAIDKIPDKVSTVGEILKSESIPESTEMFYFFSLRDSDVQDGTIMAVSPTALGRSVRNELEGILRKAENVEQASVIFTDVVKRTPILCISFDFEGKSFIVGFYEKASGYIGRTQHICVLSTFANKWQIYFDQALDEMECIPFIADRCEIIVHNKKLYFYFERMIRNIGSMFQGMGFAEFSIFDFENKYIATLLYQGTFRNQGIEGDFNFELLKSAPNGTDYVFMLEQQASKSDFVYRTPRDYNIDDVQNFIEKWNVENPDFYNNTQGIVKFFFYNENILWDTDKYISLEDYKANTSFIENDEFLLFYYFAGAVLAFRKSDNKYFVVLVPEGYGAGGTWGLRSISSVIFLDEESILARNDYESYQIHLGSGAYMRSEIER